jgi:outer membrane protein assembly factor BamE (lipoprotein component of BamABCDE complex)
MKQAAPLILAVGLALGLTGCTTVSGPAALGDATDDTLKHDLVQGVTTMDDVRKDFGDPQFVDLRDNGDTEWAYIYRKNDAFAGYKAMFGGAAATAGETRLTVDFDKAKKVRRYALSHD